MNTAVANPAAEPMVAMPVADVYHRVVEILSYLPGQLVAEVDLYALSKAVADAEVAALDKGTSALYPAACDAIVAHADAIFRKNDWFKTLSLALLKTVAGTHA